MPCLAIDWGASRVGVATSASDVLATPLCVLSNDERLLDALAEIAREHQPDTVIVGLPRRERETPETLRIRQFAADLERTLQLPVHLWDESYSTIEATEKTGVRKGKRKQQPIDDRAAAVILQSWIDSGGPRP